MKKIAFCFLAKDAFFNIELWKEYFKSVDKEKYAIFLHSKEPIDLELMNVTIIPSIPTQWASVSLVKATYLLFQEASKTCDYFFFLSADTIPLVPFSKLYSIDQPLFSIAQHQDAGRLHFMHLNYIECDQKFQDGVPFWKGWHKQHMFFGLCKESFLKIDYSTIDFVTNIMVPDEFFWINICFYLNISYQIGKYIYTNPNNEIDTQAISINPALFSDQKSIIYEHLFLRKVENYSLLTDYFIPL